LATDAALYQKISADNDVALDLVESSPAAKHYA
jgi:malate dehydrogenase (quinone)